MVIIMSTFILSIPLKLELTKDKRFTAEIAEEWAEDNCGFEGWSIDDFRLKYAEGGGQKESCQVSEDKDD